ncbi:hypothetical protein BJ508DRAFT_329747 [Ascobolus immersus RN42]|uniref:NADH-ubiquinone oxidoreductase 14 kDa subunit n=1 Tax=Ascobolus immersus RN42 TaxID=1160509 RepID=A0A3N4I1K0_ASCIM|nr:hypothetical protein BJ508DRAFT_329747 [Ascobolus immersus RN42]
MSSMIFGWAGFGALVNFWRLGIQKRPLFGKETLVGYPIGAVVGGAFGYWLEGVEERQAATLENRKQALLALRAGDKARAAAQQ